MSSRATSADARLDRRERLAATAVRELANQAFSRAAGAPLVGGNVIRLLADARENYPAWLDAIGSARRHIHFESYIIHEDDTGWTFAEALVAKARAGVRVRLVYDWMGGFGKASRAFWNHLREGGVEVRCYNPPRLESPFGWLSRDHRKMLAVDGRIGFVAGLCVGRMWVGDPSRKLDPWRDTGVELRGPAVEAVERAFAQVWAMMGTPLPEGELVAAAELAPDGEMSARVVATVPATAGMLRLDQLVAALAQERLWLTDAYFAGTTSYVQALRAAAKDGVDVRLLVPGGTDIPLLRPLSRAGYRPLLDAGVRVFEWNGTMLHAKTAVADARWARVGSTNLNIASWFGNCELDVVVEDEGFACSMERPTSRTSGTRPRSSQPRASADARHEAALASGIPRRRAAAAASGARPWAPCASATPSGRRSRPGACSSPSRRASWRSSARHSSASRSSSGSTRKRSPTRPPFSARGSPLRCSIAPSG
jgi:cardiolipin synthase